MTNTNDRVNMADVTDADRDGYLAACWRHTLATWKRLGLPEPLRLRKRCYTRTAQAVHDRAVRSRLARPVAGSVREVHS